MFNSKGMKGRFKSTSSDSSPGLFVGLFTRRQLAIKIGNTESYFEVILPKSQCLSYHSPQQTLSRSHLKPKWMETPPPILQKCPNYNFPRIIIPPSKKKKKKVKTTNKGLVLYLNWSVCDFPHLPLNFSS